MKVEIEDRNLEPTLVIYLDDGTEVGNIPGLADPEYERDAMGHMLRAVQAEERERCARLLLGEGATLWTGGMAADAIRALGDE